MWRNPGEVAGDRIDNDGNGYVDDVHGWDFANNDADPFDDEGHGTHVAGTIGAVGNNGVGVVGVSWNVSLMALKFLGADGSGSTSGAIAAVNYATRMRQSFSVNVVATNNSWGGGGASNALRDAIANGGTAGIVCVAAAGNEATNNDTTPSYPANYPSDAIISVAATDAFNRLASFSNYGATTVDVGAPGVGIYSTVPNAGYASYSGTSMAAPQVTGTVALLAAANPQATAAQIRSAILSTAVPVAALAGKVATGGLVNASAALAALGGTEPPPPPPPPPPSGAGEPNDSLATATPVTLSGGRATVSATIGDGAFTAADVDLYAVTLAAGTVLTADIDASSLATPSSLDSYLRVFAASGSQLAANDDAGGSFDSLVSYTVPTAGTYYIGVSSYGNSTYAAATAGSGTAGSTTGGYTLTVSAALPAPTADVIDVSPDPRTTSVSAVVVQFSRAVNGVDAADFTLTRSGTAVSLAGVTVTTTDNVRWTVNGLSTATASAGTYVLTINATGSGIAAVDGGTAFATAVSDTWVTQAAALTDAGDSRAGSVTAPTDPGTSISTGSCSPRARRSSSTSMPGRSPADPRSTATHGCSTPRAGRWPPTTTSAGRVTATSPSGRRPPAPTTWASRATATRRTRRRGPVPVATARPASTRCGSPSRQQRRPVRACGSRARETPLGRPRSPRRSRRTGRTGRPRSRPFRASARVARRADQVTGAVDRRSARGS